ncbi:MAG: hypothetical protein JW705_07730 [Methanosarcinaceae archaeon]|nr:hypothetical protein [Methanosarcinaceae archaeon]
MQILGKNVFQILKTEISRYPVVAYIPVLLFPISTKNGNCKHIQTLAHLKKPVHKEKQEEYIRSGIPYPE